jgi:hypothetical protein
VLNIIDTHQSRLRFLAIVDEIRQALGYDLRREDPEPGVELAMEMSYGGFEFAVVHSLHHSASRILIECRFGSVPQGREEAIMMRLLEMNCALAEIEDCKFCLDTEKDELIYALALDIDSHDGSSVLSKMTETVWHARRWLETRFMQLESESPVVSFIPVGLA